jgi:hypothetical protein
MKQPKGSMTREQITAQCSGNDYSLREMRLAEIYSHQNEVAPTEDIYSTLAEEFGRPRQEIKNTAFSYLYGAERPASGESAIEFLRRKLSTVYDL